MLSVAPNAAARVVRAIAVLVLLALAIAQLLTSKPAEALFFGGYLVAFVVVTSRTMPVSGQTLAMGAGIGAAAAVVPTVAIVLWPPAPLSGNWAAAMVATAAVTAGATAAGRKAGASAVVVAGLLAAIVAALLIPISVSLLAQAGPESWVPWMDSPALTPAARLAERRQLAAEDYLPTFLIGDLLALMTGVVVLQLRTWGRRSAVPAGPPQQIELTR